MPAPTRWAAERARSPADPTNRKGAESPLPGRLAALPRLYQDDDGSPSEADTILRDGWRFAARPAIQLSAPFPWSDVIQADADWGTELHAWTPIAPLLSAYYRTGRPLYLDRAVSFARDWLERHGEASEEIIRKAAPARAHRLAFTLDAASRQRRFDGATVRALRDGLSDHLRSASEHVDGDATTYRALLNSLAWLSVSGRFSGLAHASKARAHGVRSALSALGRLAAPDGGTLEHSPDSQRVLVNRLGELKRGGTPLGEPLAERVAAIEDGLAWFITPRRTLAQIGDTKPAVRIESTAVHPHLEFVDTGTTRGVAPVDSWKAFPDSGWFAVRAPTPPSRRPVSECSYVLQTCGRHSGRHKHEDDFSFVWFEKQRAILIDGGWYGANAPDQNRAYVKSERTHNVVSIDEGLAQRPQPKRFGSGLTAWGEQRQVFFSQCERRLGGVHHVRVLAFRPYAWLAVIDVLHDRSGTEHGYSQRFMFDALLDPKAAGNIVAAELGDGQNVFAIPFLDASLSGVWRGRRKPFEGWCSSSSGELVPAGTIKFTNHGARAALACVFWLGERPPKPDPELSRVNASARRIRLVWDGDGRRHQIDVTRDDRLEVRYRAPKSD